MATKKIAANGQRPYNVNRHHGKPVDPDALLQSISFFCNLLRTGDGIPEDEHGDPIKPVAVLHFEAVAALVDDIEALLGHMAKGGRLPTPWTLGKLAAASKPEQITGYRKWIHDVNRMLDDHVGMISSDLPPRDWQAAYDNGEAPAEAVLRFYGDPTDKTKFLANVMRRV